MAASVVPEKCQGGEQCAAKPSVSADRRAPTAASPRQRYIGRNGTTSSQAQTSSTVLAEEGKCVRSAWRASCSRHHHLLKPSRRRGRAGRIGFMQRQQMIDGRARQQLEVARPRARWRANLDDAICPPWRHLQRVFAAPLRAHGMHDVRSSHRSSIDGITSGGSCRSGPCR